MGDLEMEPSREILLEGDPLIGSSRRIARNQRQDHSRVDCEQSPHQVSAPVKRRGSRRQETFLLPDGVVDGPPNFSQVQPPADRRQSDGDLELSNPEQRRPLLFFQMTNTPSAETAEGTMTILDRGCLKSTHHDWLHLVDGMPHPGFGVS